MIRDADMSEIGFFATPPACTRREQNLTKKFLTFDHQPWARRREMFHEYIKFFDTCNERKISFAVAKSQRHRDSREKRPLKRAMNLLTATYPSRINYI
jgi:hypothetical protein